MITDIFEVQRTARPLSDMNAHVKIDTTITAPVPSPRRAAEQASHSAMQTLLALLAAMIALFFLTACATTGATYRSGVGDSFPDAPPYYAGTRLEIVARDSGTIGHFPIAYQRGASQPAIFDPRDRSGSPVDVLLEEMNAYLDSLGVSMRIVEGRRVSAVAHAATVTPPDVRFGCETLTQFPDGDCIDRDGALGRGRLPMHLSVGRPSPEWIAWNRELMDECGVKRTLVITLEIGQYLTRQRGWRGSKEVDLGTSNVAKLPWLTSLETPVSVLQLTGALVDRDGKAVRIGAEGFYARRSRLAVSALGAQEIITDDDVRQARTLRREELPGSPLAWRVALRELVAGLTSAELR